MSWITATDGDTGKPLSTGQKIIWAIGALIVVLIIAGEFTDDEPAMRTSVPPAVCGEWGDVAESDLDGDGLLIAVGMIADKAKGGPVEAEAAEVLSAAMASDQQRSIAAVRAMHEACD